MQQQNKSILQDSVAQLQCAREGIYSENYNRKVVELTVELDKYKSQEQVALNKAIEELKKAYDKAINEKAQAFEARVRAMEEQIQAKAKAFAEAQVAETDKLIQQVNALIAKE